MSIIQFGVPYYSPIAPYPIQTIEPTNTVLPRNVANFMDPTGYSDMELAVRKNNYDLVNTIGYMDYLQTCGLWG